MAYIFQYFITFPDIAADLRKHFTVDARFSEPLIYKHSQLYEQVAGPKNCPIDMLYLTLIFEVKF